MESHSTDCYVILESVLLADFLSFSTCSFKQVSLYESYNRKEANAYSNHMSGEMDPSPVEPPDQSSALAWVFVL